MSTTKFIRSTVASRMICHVPMTLCLLLALSRSVVTMAQTDPPPVNLPTNTTNTTSPVFMPTSDPIHSDSPTPAPFVTEQPTIAPITNEPTDVVITGSPTSEPINSDSPTPAPFVTEQPTLAPITDEPTVAPVTVEPTVAPVSSSPTLNPVTNAPTLPPVTGSPTAAPVTNTPSLNPVTISPTISPVTASPTTAPVKVTLAPTTASPTTGSPTIVTSSPTSSPTTSAPTTAAPTTAAPTTVAPSKAPTNAPTEVSMPPTDLPTAGLTSSPTATPTVQPSASPSTPKLTETPSVSPSATLSQAPTTSSSFLPTEITDTPSISPSSPQSTTESPSSITTTTIVPTKATGESTAPTITVDKTTSGVTFTLGGINSIEDTASWSKTTTDFFTAQYQESEKLSNVVVEVTLTSQQSSEDVRRNIRGLQTASVEVTYEQALAYSTSDSSFTLDDALKLPLATTTQQDEYIASLKQLDGYSDLTSVSAISVPSSIDPTPNPEPEGGVPQWAIIVIILISVLVLVVAFLIVIRRRRASGSAGGLEQDSPTYEPSGYGSSSGPGLGDETVETMDYDYAKAYGGLAGDASLSEAGGTMGSRLAPQAGNTIFSDDPTFNEAYDGGHEEVIDIYAPAGKLGVVIDTPNDDAPIVHAVKDSSPIANQVKVGDKLVAVDDEDVRALTAIKVSKLISKKSTQESRKLTVIRYVSSN